MKSLQQKASAWLNSSDEHGHNTNKSKVDAYLAGALVERERAKHLVDAIKLYKQTCVDRDCTFTELDVCQFKIKTALAEYEGGV